jgi:hypothetical protein
MIISLSRARAYFEAELPATDEGDDLELIAIGNECIAKVRPAQDAAVPLHRHAAGIEAEVLEQSLDGDARGELVRLAVEKDAGYFFPSFLFAAR